MQPLQNIPANHADYHHHPHAPSSIPSGGGSLPSAHYDMAHSGPGAPPTYTHVMPDVVGADDSAMWGASVGFQHGEWTRFVDVMQRPDTTSHVR